MKPLKLFLTIISSISISVFATGNEKISLFPLDRVELTDSNFRNAMEIDKRYMLELDADRLLAPYLREAGLKPKAESYTNWENTGLDGHIGGHYVSALSLMYAASGDTDIKDRLDYMISEWARVQEANGNGYIGGVPGSKQLWDEIASGKIKAGEFSLNDKWVPLYNIHKTFAGLRDAYIHAGIGQAKDMLIKYTDWMLEIVAGLNDKQISDMLISEHGGLNEVFADVYAITGDEKYLRLAKQFSDWRILDPLITGEDRLTGMHANTQIPKVIGYERIAQLENNAEWHDATIYFWDNVVNHRTISIGGNSVREYFHPVDDYSRMLSDREGPETCNTYNMMRLSMMLFSLTVDKKYLDFYERAMYNHILSTQHPEKGGFVYFTSMRPGHYRVYSQPHTSFWCCVGSGLENHAKYGELIYAYKDDDIFVNLFIPSVLDWREKGIKFTQETAFPEEEKTTLTIDTKKSKKFTVNIRYPEWLKGEYMNISINGEPHTFLQQNGFVSIERKWKKGDRIDIELPLTLRAEQIPDGQEFYSILYGPIVLGMKTDRRNMDGLFAGDGRGDHIASGKYFPMNEGVPMIVHEGDDFINLITKMDGKLEFDVMDVIYDPDPRQVLLSVRHLEPFYNIHESRYAIYFQKTTREEYEKDLYKRIAEKKRLELEENTIDLVRPGEQQYESDHGFAGMGTTTGISNGERWRNADGWFSYKLNNKNIKDSYIRIVLWSGDKGATFKITVNNGELTRMVRVPSGDNEFVVEEITLPDNLSGNIYEVKFDEFSGFMDSGLYDVRVMDPRYKGRDFSDDDLY